MLNITLSIRRTILKFLSFLAIFCLFLFIYGCSTSQDPWYIASEGIVKYFNAGMHWDLKQSEITEVAMILSRELPSIIDMEGNQMSKKIANQLVAEYNPKNAVAAGTPSEFRRFWMKSDAKLLFHSVDEAYNHVRRK